MCDSNPINRNFKGIWIPKELYLNHDLTWTEKILLMEIDSLDHGQGCFASNNYLAEFLGVSRDWIKHVIGNLKEKSLIVVDERDGRRFIKLSDGATGLQDIPDDQSGDGEVEVPPGSEISLTENQENDILTVYEFWNSYCDQGNGKWHHHVKLSYAIKLAVSIALTKYSVEDVCMAIANYASILQTDDHYWTYVWSLNGFLSTERSTGEKKWLQFLPDNFEESAYRGQKIEEKENEEIIVPEDKNPDITGRLIKMYRNLINNQKFEPSPKQTAQFIEASDKMVKYFSGSFETVPLPERFKMLRMVLEKKYVEAGEILNVGNLNSKYTWEVLMPQLMREIGYYE